MVNYRRMLLTVFSLIFSFVLGLSMSLIDARMKTNQSDSERIVSFEDELHEFRSMKLAFSPYEASE